MVKLVAHQKADNLSIREWGKARLNAIQSSNGESFIVINSIIRKVLVDNVWFYDNNNMLLHVVNHDGMSRSGYMLLMPNTFSRIFAEISEVVFDEKYRKVVDYNKRGERVLSLINEKSGKLEFPMVHWADIIDVNDDIATIAFFKKEQAPARQTLVRFKQNLTGNELVAREIVHVRESLYKFRHDSHLYKLYNANNRQSSDERTGYTDLVYISDQIAMGIIDNVQWDFINIHTMNVVCTSYQEPVFENDIIHVVSYDDNDDEVEFNINLSGTILSEGNQLDLSIESGEYNLVSNKDIVDNVKEVDVCVPTVTIGRFIIVNDDSVKRSTNGNYIFSKKALNKPCRIERGVICWILIKENAIIVTRRDGISNSRRTILYEDVFPEDLKKYGKLAEKKWHIEDYIICTEEENVIHSAIEAIKSKLQNKVESLEIGQQVNDDVVSRDTKDVLQLKAIYSFLKQQGYDNESIYKALYSLFPSIEQFVDMTNVKTEYEDVYNKVINLTKKRDQISSSPSKLIEMLNLNERDLAILNYYMKAKGLSIGAAIEYVGKESSTGSMTVERYNKLMRIGNDLLIERDKLRKLIVDDLIHGFASIAETSEVLKPIKEIIPPDIIQQETLPDMTDADFLIDESKRIQTVFKDVIIQFHLNEVVNYVIFQNKKVYNFNHDIHYVQMGKDTLVFISKDKALELDAEHPHIIRIRGNGEDKRFSQVFSYINASIKGQRENNSRILMFKLNDENTCLFFDELQYLDYDLEKEEGREIIMFKLKSLLRYNSD